MTWRDTFVGTPLRPAMFGREWLRFFVRRAMLVLAVALVLMGVALLLAPPMPLGRTGYFALIALFGVATALYAAATALKVP